MSSTARHAPIFGALGPPAPEGPHRGGSSTTGLFIGFLIGAGVMILGGIVEVVIGIDAEGKSLETVTKPLTYVAD